MALMPGTGEGKPPPLHEHPARGTGSPRSSSSPGRPWSPTPSSTASGSSAPTSSSSFHLSDAGLGAVTFVAAVAQIGWGDAGGGVRRPRQPQERGGGDPARLLRWESRSWRWRHNVWLFVFLYLIAAVGLGSSDTVHNAYLADAYPAHGARPRLRLAQHERPAVADRRHPARRLHRLGSPTTGAGGLGLALVGMPDRAGDLLHPGAGRRAPTSRATSSKPPAWTSSPSRRVPPRSCSDRR